VPVLKHVVFTAPAGSTTALVGSSGSGKSTLISLVMTFNRRHRARARRRPRSDVGASCATYRAQLGVVLQDNFLFDGTIAENIAYGKPHATREEIKAVSRSPTATSSSRRSRRVRHDRRRARRRLSGGSGSAWRSRARSWPTRAS
jgi:subfamily B ATP-binding cassette protein MsbA